MQFQIKNRFTEAVIFECELPPEIAEKSASRQLGYAIKEALKTRAYLAGANLADAYLAGADLADAYLADADLADADLADANLAGANLADAKNVPETNGSESAPEGVPESTDRRERQRQRAERFRARNPDVPVIHDLDARILGILDSGAGKLQMSTWHTCETTHCRAGWAITLAGEAGKKLEDRYGPFRAGCMIYRASTGQAPHFFASDERALEDIKRCAAEQESGAPNYPDDPNLMGST